MESQGNSRKERRREETSTLKERKERLAREKDGPGRTTVAHGYYELHNTWSSHNGAAPGCGRAGGMSFSPFAVEKTILVSILSPHDTALPSPSGTTFSSPGNVSSTGYLSVGTVKLLFYEASRRRNLSETHFVRGPRETEINLLPTLALTNFKNFRNENFSKY